MTNPVSFFGSFNAQTTRLQGLNSLMQDMQRQFATQKKSDTLAGLGFDAQSVQRYRMDKSRLQSYMSNIDQTTTRVNLMSDSLSRASQIGRDFLSSLYSQMRSSDVDMDTVQQQAKQYLQLLQDLSNQEIDGRYLFAGGNTASVPLPNLNTVNNTMQTQLNNWFNGSQTTAQLTANIGALSSTGMGFDPGLSSAGTVSIQVDNNTSIDYTSLAGSNGMQDLVRNISLVANLRLPDPSTDTATQANFNDLLDSVISSTQAAVKSVDSSNAQITGKSTLLGTLRDNHVQDVGLFETLIAKKEDVDTTEIATKIQALQTQLTASYQVASYVSQLSLANFLS